MNIPVPPEDTDIEGESAGMQCKAQTTAIPSGIARICNAAVRPTDQSQVGIFRWNGYTSREGAKTRRDIKVVTHSGRWRAATASDTLTSCLRVHQNLSAA